MRWGCSRMWPWKHGLDCKGKHTLDILVKWSLDESLAHIICKDGQWYRCYDFVRTVSNIQSMKYINIVGKWGIANFCDSCGSSHEDFVFRHSLCQPYALCKPYAYGSMHPQPRCALAYISIVVAKYLALLLAKIMSLTLIATYFYYRFVFSQANDCFSALVSY